MEGEAAGAMGVGLAVRVQVAEATGLGAVVMGWEEGAMAWAVVVME